MIMDILDVDEALGNDDSFCLMEEKNHDDIANILQQWRNNVIAQGTRLDTRTFTRPKRKSASHSDSNYLSNASSPSAIANGADSSIDLQIGGLVTNIQRNSLQDVSPPFSICSSMDLNQEKMGNSLITSADFSNVSFLKTLDSEDLLKGYRMDCIKDDDLNMENSLVTSADFSNVSFFKTPNPKDFLKGFHRNSIKEDDLNTENLLETMTLSGDSPIIKDSQIAQIDEICYMTNSSDKTFNSIQSYGDAFCKFGNQLPTENLADNDLIEDVTFTMYNSKVCNEGNFDDDCNETIRPISKAFVAGAVLKNDNKLQETYVSVPVDPVNHEDDINSTFSVKKISSPSKTKKSSTPEKANDNLIELQSTPYVQKSRFTLLSQVSTDISPIVPDGNQLETKESVMNLELSKEGTNGLDLFKDETEEEFDNILENFGSQHTSKEPAKMLESLHNIRKRLSTVSEKSNDVKFTSPSGRRSISAGNNGERLLSRRSRLFDDVPLDKLQGSLEGSNTNATEIEKSEDCNVDVPVSQTHNDPFKTMRIAKKTSYLENRNRNENNSNPSDSKPYHRNKDTLSEVMNKYESIESKEVGEIDLRNTVSTQKVASTGDLEKSCTESISRKTISKLPTEIGNKNIGGVKAKSIQNLPSHFGFSNKISVRKSSLNTQPGFTQPRVSMAIKQEVNSHPQIPARRQLPTKQPDAKTKKTSGTFKIPQFVPSVRPDNRRSGLMRPSSGFYSYNAAKAIYDIENSRNSSSNSLSSVSSKGSMPEAYRKSESEDQSSDDNEMMHHNNTTIIHSRVPTLKSSIPKPSGLKQPSALKSKLPMSAASSGLRRKF